MVTDCFIRRSRHSAQLEMYVNRTLLEAASATSRSNHLDALSRLCSEKSLGNRDVHPLDDYHLTPARPTILSHAPARVCAGLAIPRTTAVATVPTGRPGPPEAEARPQWGSPGNPESTMCIDYRNPPTR